jgi:membrane-bound ClpP family serine protease
VYLVGDADRERGLARLRRDYADGRLSIDELDVRAEALARARTTRELRLALRGLPYGRVESELVPRLAALRSSPVAARAVRVALGAALLVLWLSASLVLLGVLGLAMLFAGPSGELAAAFTLAWVALTWLSWRIWRGGARISRG